MVRGLSTNPANALRTPQEATLGGAACGGAKPPVYARTAILAAQQKQESNENLPPAVITAVLREMKELTEKPSEGITVRGAGSGRGRAGPTKPSFPSSQRLWRSSLCENAAPPPRPQVYLNEDNVADVQADLEGPGAREEGGRWAGSARCFPTHTRIFTAASSHGRVVRNWR